MRVLTVRNAHEALPRALRLLENIGVSRESRNGIVVMAPYPVATVYERPCERVLFWPQRDCNIFFLLAEALWMLAGRNDLALLQRYVKNFDTYSNDGITLNGAYGHRWRGAFGMDQLLIIAERLRKNPEDRRCVLQMWDAGLDLSLTDENKDVCCNDTITFQRDQNGALDMVVFCRSNDIIFGAYFANMFHFSVLLEYMALWIGCPVGKYTQVSVNWHAYEKILKTVEGLHETAIDHVDFIDNPYIDHRVKSIPMDSTVSIDVVDNCIDHILYHVDDNLERGIPLSVYPWAYHVWLVLQAHERYRAKSIDGALKILERGDQQCDWIVAAKQWLLRRLK